MSDPILAAAAGHNGGQYIAPGGTGTPDRQTHFAFVQAMNGDVLLSAHDGTDISNLPSALTLKEGVAYAFRFTSVTVDAGSTGGLVCFEA